MVQILTPRHQLGPTSVEYLDVAKTEAHGLLTPAQYAYVVRNVRELAQWPDAPDWLWVEPIDEFYELKLKGNVLGKINLRVYFGQIPGRRTVVLVGVYKKEAEGKVPRHIVLKMRNRYRAVLQVYKVAPTRKV